jgi:hypothetical protein
MYVAKPRMPRVGEIVTHRTRDANKRYNGDNDHPALVTRVCSENCVNLKVLPDCGDVYDVSSQSRIDPENHLVQGWFHPAIAD